METYREMKERLVKEFKDFDWNFLNVDKLIDIKIFIEKNFNVIIGEQS
jgi:hypothetical protein